MIFVGSIMTQALFAGSVGYVSTKAALEGVTRALAVELGPHRIRVNAVLPGFTQVGLTSGQRRRVPVSLWPEFAERFAGTLRVAYAEQQPLRYGIDARDVAHAVAFLCSDFAGGISGVTLPVDGAFHLQASGSSATRELLEEFNPEMDEWLSLRLNQKDRA